jgi:hypothetical protein
VDSPCDLSNIGRQLTLPELEQSLNDPSESIARGWAVVNAHLRDGSVLRGFARHQGKHDLQLQTTGWPPELPVRCGIRRGDSRESFSDACTGRYARQNVSKLHLQWTYSLPYFGLEMTPLEIDGVMYVTGPNRVCALDPRTGRELWCYSRPRTPAGTIAGDAAKGANRGVAALGDRVFFITDNAHPICLNGLTGALQWDVLMPEEPQHYGGTSAPLVAGDLVNRRCRRSRPRYPRLRRRLQSHHGPARLAVLDDPTSRRTWLRDLAVQCCRDGRRIDLAYRLYDPESRVLYWPTGNPLSGYRR